jgi:hypothetical protein
MAEQTPAPEPGGDQPVDLSGWTRMTTIDEPRLSELVELYEELGHEIMLRPVAREELGDNCLECYLLQPERYRTIYTRRSGD